MRSKGVGQLMAGVLVAAGLVTSLAPTAVTALALEDLSGPAGSGAFGKQVLVLANGNLVVTDPLFDAPGAADAGAVYLYDGDTRQLISVVTGSTASDQVGAGVLLEVGNNNFVVGSPYWYNGAISDAGALTWVNGFTGLAGVVDASNSLVGTSIGDNVGANASAVRLSNGNYVSMVYSWDNGSVEDAGAVTLGSSDAGVFGPITAANSLVGSSAQDYVGQGGVTPLTNGNYVVVSQSWDNGGVADAGAVTWGNGVTGVVGPVSAANSLVGSVADDQVGAAATSASVVALSNGNYAVASPYWDNAGVMNAGAVTWGDGATGTVGAVSAANSRVGSAIADEVGHDGIVALTNGNYVFASPSWDNGATAGVGAVTWGNGAGGSVGPVSAANSLIGGAANDVVGAGVITALTNGNYVVTSRQWSNGGVAVAGAATWGDGSVGTVGVVSAANSLVGSTVSDEVGVRVVALTNGNYVVLSHWWDNGGIADAGAATWGNGAGGTVGPVSAANSLVGATANDRVGEGGVTALTNGNYVVSTFGWSNGGAAWAGAATWGNGATGTTGAVTSANSLVGSTAFDSVSTSVVALTNGNYVVASYGWRNGGIGGAGAVTWGDGSTGTAGAVSAANSIVGLAVGDQLGAGGVIPLSNGDYVFSSPGWDNGATGDAGAITWAMGTGPSTGGVDGSNSVRGNVASTGYTLVVDDDPLHSSIVVGRPEENVVTWMQYGVTPPTDVMGVPGDAEVLVSWVPPAQTGGLTIADYWVDAYDPNGNSAGLCIVDFPATECLVGGLTNGVEYTFTVTAFADNGTWATSAPSPGVTPMGTGEWVNRLTVLKVVEGYFPPDTEFTVHVMCSVDEVDEFIRFDVEGTPIDDNIIELFNDYDDCLVKETVTGGALSVSYECWDNGETLKPYLGPNPTCLGFERDYDYPDYYRVMYDEVNADGTDATVRITNVGADPKLTLSKQVCVLADQSTCDTANNAHWAESTVVTQGTAATFRIAVTNTGNVDLAPVAISDPAAPACNATFPKIAKGAAQVYKCVLDPVPSVLRNVATATGNPVDDEGSDVLDPDTGQPIADVTATDTADVQLAPNVTIAKAVSSSTAVQGGLVTYTLTAANKGLGPAAGVVAVDTLPAGMEPEGALPTAMTYDAATRQLTWKVGDLAPGASLQVQYTVRVTAVGTLVNVVSVQSLTPGDLTTDNGANVSLVVSEVGRIPSTGSDTAVVLKLALGLLVAGLAAVGWARRRRSAQA